jgi:diguanylate cyclase (GGDEF)-like protein
MTELAIAQPSTYDNNLDGAVVLIVDDSIVVRALLEDELAHQGATVISAEDGASALALLAGSQPDVVLLDVEMPGLDGFAVLAAIREHPLWCDLPVVFLTGRDRTTDLVDGLRRGATDYLRKPFDALEMVARVMTARRTGALQAELRRRNDELEHLSLTDPLTGLPNRRHLHSVLDAAAAQGQRGVAIVDIDHFKRVNDEHGHPAGDQVIAEVAARLRAAVGAAGVVGRWGGEEFLVVVPDLSALEVARRCHLAIGQDPIAVEDQQPLLITVSIGVAMGERPDVELLGRADEALYAAKEAGRNRVVGHAG